MKLQLIEKDICPKCGNRFDCGKSGKCWCFEINIAPSLLERLEKKYSSCLCPACLENYAKQNPEN